MTKKALKEEEERIRNVVNFLIKKLKLDLNIEVSHFSNSAIKKQFRDTILAVSRSSRSLEDKDTFIIFFNPELTIDSSIPKLKRHLLHEILHIVCQPYTDEYYEVIKYVQNKALKSELEKRAYETRECVTYLLERKFGPLLIPDADWSSED